MAIFISKNDEKLHIKFSESMEAQFVDRIFKTHDEEMISALRNAPCYGREYEELKSVNKMQVVKK